VLVTGGGGSLDGLAATLMRSLTHSADDDAEAPPRTLAAPPPPPPAR
jgi:hypothetical protein